MGNSFNSFCFTLFLVLAIAGQAHAFGAGNIASIARIEGQNWRHGDIEDTLLSLFLARVAGGRKFSKLDVQRVYFGNWLRDYSQAVDIGTLKYVSAEAIRILIWVLGFMNFGYGTDEFEVTTERLGCYQPTEHIDNPQGYGEGVDGRDYDRRLRGPVDERRELGVDPRTGLKNYISSEDKHIDTSAGLVRRTLGRSIELGRRYARSGNHDDLYEALRLLGTGLHCLEDYAAHSNYTELSLIELEESEIFPHVGRNTTLHVEGARSRVYPIVTGTFGGVDFFHSVLGEVSDRAAQSEVQTLEGVIDDSQGGSPSQSFLQDLLSKIPDGLLSDKDDQANKMDGFKAQADDAKQNKQNVNPRKPEEWTRFLSDVQKQIYPVLEWHDGLIKTINQAIEKFPVLPDLIEQFQEQMNVFVFSILAPYVLPIIKQVKTELQTGSSEVIQSSKDQQHIVFNDDNCSNPTHSMLSKDHFSNVLNEPAGRIASQIVKWTVPQLMECWDNEDINIARTLDRIITGVFHHPVLRDGGRDGARDIRGIMFGTVEDWWKGKSGRERELLRKQLSRKGVLDGKNHKEGVHDSGHGCGKPISLPNRQGKSGHDGSGHGGSGGSHSPDSSGIGKVAVEAAGGGALGGLVGELVGGIGSMVLNGGDDKKSENDEHENHSSSHYSHSQRHDDHRHRHHEPRDEHQSKHHPSHTARHEHETEHSGGGHNFSGRHELHHQSGYGGEDHSGQTHTSGHAGLHYGSSNSGRPSYGDERHEESGYGRPRPEHFSGYSGRLEEHGRYEGSSEYGSYGGYGGGSHGSSEQPHGGYGQGSYVDGRERFHGYGGGSHVNQGGYGERPHGYGQGSYDSSERSHGYDGGSHVSQGEYSERPHGYGQGSYGSSERLNGGYGQGHESGERRHGYGGGSRVSQGEYDERPHGYGQTHSGSHSRAHGGGYEESYGESYGGSHGGGRGYGY